MQRVGKQTGFTIVELLIVVVVIAILAAITIVSYNGIQQSARASVLASELASAAKLIQMDQVKGGSYPATPGAINGGRGLTTSGETYFRYRPTTAGFCLTAINGPTVYMATESSTPAEGSCYNLARGISSPSAILTDEQTHHTPYYSLSTGLQSVTINLGAVYDVSKVKVWHYWSDGRTYYQTRTEVSEDGTNWTTIFNSATSGTYAETSAGREYTFDMRKVRFIRDWLAGSTSNTGNHWVEIQAY